MQCKQCEGCSELHSENLIVIILIVVSNHTAFYKNKAPPSACNSERELQRTIK